ncbi:hypothetical protein GC173_14240 [bacterium]|nr:hypothetical protein [bacterium]
MSDDDAPSPPRTDGRPYRVGYGKPPAEHQFRKNDGRKRGRRPKGSQNLKTLVRKEHARMVRLRGKDGQVKQRTALAAMVQQDVAEAFENHRVRARQFDLADRYDAEDEARAGARKSEALAAEDAAILARYLPAALEEQTSASAEQSTAHPPAPSLSSGPGDETP